MRLLRVAVCEDEGPIREYLQRLLTQYAGERGIDCKVLLYENGERLLKSGEEIDLILMDYQLDYTGEKNGLLIAQEIRKTNRTVAIIFLTKHPKVVFSAFEVNTFRFLVKPIVPEKLFQALDDYEKLRDAGQALLIRTEALVMRHDLADVLYLEGDGKYCIIYLHGQKECVSSRETLAEVEKRLPRFLFFRCHKSFVVHFAYVRSYNRREVCLSGGVRLPISRTRFAAFQQRFMDYTQQFLF